MFHGVLKSWRLPIAALFVIAAPTVALAARGYATATVSMRAGPGPAYPIVTRVPGGAHLTIHGCLSGYSWCDVSWHRDRGWVRAAFLDYFYRNRYVYLPDYVDEIDVPIVTFVLADYWDNYYVGRPFFHRRAHFAQYWRDHGSVGISRRAGPVTRGDRNAAVVGRTGRAGPADVTRQDHVRGGPGRHDRSDRLGMRGEHGRHMGPQGGRHDRFGGRNGAHIASPGRSPRGAAHLGGPGGHGPRFGGPGGGHARMGGPAGRPQFSGHGGPHIGGPGPGVGAHLGGSPARLGGPGGGGHMGGGPRMGGGGPGGGPGGHGGGPGGHGPRH